MYYLIYVSGADHPMGEDELVDILTHSRSKNAASGITGLLLYKEISDSREASFMQVL